MTINTQHGSPSFPTTTSALAPSSHEDMDRAIGVLVEQKENWVKVPVGERIRIVDALIGDFTALAPRWVEVSLRAKGLDEDSPYAGDEWSAGTWAFLHMLRQLRQALVDIQQNGHPHIPGPVRTRQDGQVKAQVFPFRSYDRVLFSGVKAEVWMQPGVTPEKLSSTQAVNYQSSPVGKVALVLGAGNVASIGPLDVLYKLFTDNQVVLFKANPVNAYLGPLMAEAFHSLIDAGYLRIIYGGAEEGSYLCQHPNIDEIHITGSDKTFDAIVFGPGAEGAARKAARQPLVSKRVTGELGNVSPVIVIPGPWSEGDLAYQAVHIASMLVNNAGYNCNATRVIIQHKNWTQRQQFLQQIRSVLSHLPTRSAYYPGARDRYQAFLDAHPEAEIFGGTDEPQHLPWTLIADVDASQTDDICFTTEAFCSLFSETALDAASVVEYIERAVQFANEQLWGTLNVTLLVHPRSLKDPAVAAAVGQAIAQLRYGSVGVNYWAGTSFVLGSTTWGAFPGHEIHDIQSGNDVVHNSLMFSHPQKSVLYAPFRSIPTPPWFTSQARIAPKLFKQLVRFEQSPSWLKIPAIVMTALFG